MSPEDRQELMDQFWNLTDDNDSNVDKALLALADIWNMTTDQIEDEIAKYFQSQMIVVCILITERDSVGNNYIKLNG